MGAQHPLWIMKSKISKGVSGPNGCRAPWKGFCISPLSPKFKRVSLNETLEFPVWGLNIFVDFDLSDSKIIENMKKLNKFIFHYKNIEIHETV